MLVTGRAEPCVNKNQYSYSIPIKNCPYGFCKLVVKATDAYDRVSQDIVYFYVKDLIILKNQIVQ